ncbi:MAG: hypothetical protein RhofKO_39540 [Rhodothermales bacterium]
MTTSQPSGLKRLPLKRLNFALADLSILEAFSPVDLVIMAGMAARADDGSPFANRLLGIAASNVRRPDGFWVLHGVDGEPDPKVGESVVELRFLSPSQAIDSGDRVFLTPQMAARPWPEIRAKLLSELEGALGDVLFDACDYAEQIKLLRGMDAKPWAEEMTRVA